MRILFILDFYYPSKGGVEKVFKNIISNLPKNWEIKIITSKFSKDLDSYEKKENIEIFRIGKNRFWFTILAPFLARKEIKKVDIIHTSTYNAAFVSFFSNIFNKKPIVITSHEILGKKWYNLKGPLKGFFYKKLEDLIYKFNFFFVFVSNHVRNIALISYNIPLKKSLTIYNAIKIQHSNLDKKQIGYNKDDIIGLFLGRPGRTKGLDIIINNVDKIQKINNKIKFLLILLEKNNRQKLKILNKIKNNPDIKIIFEKNENEVYKYISISDIGIIPSRSEGFGLSALEFSLFNKPKIISNIGALPEINWGECYFFTPDNNREFINAFKKFFDGKKNNYGYNKNINSKIMTEEYIKLYKKLIKK